MRAGVPERMVSATKPCSSVCSDDGSGTSSASTSWLMAISGLISTTSYCLRSSAMTGHWGVNWLRSKFVPPNRLAIVATTPIRFRPVRATTRMLRMISYSAGRPTSKKPITCSSAPQVNATPRKTSSTSERAELTLRTGRGVMPNVSRASRAAAVNGSVSWMNTSTRGPASASISSRMPIRLERVCTNGSGASGLMNAWMNTGRSAGSSSRRRARLAAQRVQLLGRDVDAHAQAGGEHADADEGQRDGGGARRLVRPHRIAGGGPRPVAPAQHQHVQIEEERAGRREVDDRAHADDALGEVAEVEDDAERVDRAAEPRQDRAGGGPARDQRRAEQPPGDERDRRVARQQRRQHADCDQRRAGEPVAGEVAGHQPEVGAAEVEEDQDVAERQQQRRRVDAERGRVLADHHFEVGRRQRQQQLVRPELLLFRPDPHRERWNEEQEQVGKDRVQLIEIGQVLQEEPVLPERRGGAQEDEQGDEDVAARTAEVHPQIAARQRRDDRNVYLAVHRWSQLRDVPSDVASAPPPAGPSSPPPAPAPAAPAPAAPVASSILAAPAPSPATSAPGAPLGSAPSRPADSAPASPPPGEAIERRLERSVLSQIVDRPVEHQSPVVDEQAPGRPPLPPRAGCGSRSATSSCGRGAGCSRETGESDSDRARRSARP